MVVFAHGWKNNAALDNPNLRDFRDILIRLGEADKQVCQGQNCEPRKVVGVYLGWRGLSATIEPFKTLSFWNRKKRAERVGQDGATEVLAEFAKITAGKQNRLIAIGHSFGGALMYNALQQQLVRDTAFPNQGSISHNAADLVVLVNPAVEAARFTAIREKSLNLEFSNTQSPILAIFTSKKDTATKHAFRVGRTISTLFTRYNDDRPEQRKLDKTAVGHYQPYSTHTLEYKDGIDEFTQLNDSARSWENYQKGTSDNWDLGKLILRRNEITLGDAQQINNPYLNVSVDSRVIADHNKIWGDDFFTYLYQFVAVQDMRGCWSEGKE